jgi:hypothetical protein
VTAGVAFAGMHDAVVPPFPIKYHIRLKVACVYG